MAFRTFGPVPFPPLTITDRDDPIDADWLNLKIEELGGSASLLLRSTIGAAGRGGYFFHVARSGENFRFHDFAKTPIIDLPPDQAVRLVNHASGRTYDPEMLTLCQRVINLRQDA